MFLNHSNLTRGGFRGSFHSPINVTKQCFSFGYLFFFFFFFFFFLQSSFLKKIAFKDVFRNSLVRGWANYVGGKKSLEFPEGRTKTVLRIKRGQKKFGQINYINEP